MLLSGNAVNHTTVQKQQLSVQLETRGQKARIFLLNFQSFVKHKSVANSFLAFIVYRKKQEMRVSFDMSKFQDDYVDRYMFSNVALLV